MQAINSLESVDAINNVDNKGKRWFVPKIGPTVH
jgi:hypothetical protein